MSQDVKLTFKDSLNLPTTDFPIRPNALIEDQALLERWQAGNLYTKTFTLHKGKKKFILHDGPPYANGHIHLGHAYNKILKDIIAKSKRMAGFHVPVTPGWDCHGLPIELKVTQEHSGLDAIALKKECRNYAQGWIDIQRAEFKKIGVLFDWDNPYITMSPTYEASIIRAFGHFVRNGYIEKKKKTVAWCFNDQTVLASAEIEYKDRKDPSIYVLFALDESSKKRLLGKFADKNISLVVWTTTPWTLPMNRAVLIKPNADYQLLSYNDNYIMVGAPLADKLCALLSIEKNVIETLSAAQLKQAQAQHPLLPHVVVPIIEDHSVTLEDGTAFVHCAPGCGPIDYDVGLKNNLEVYSPISSSGHYEETILPAELSGLTVIQGQGAVIKMLQENGNLLHKGSITHSYPHCWRCHNGLIFRATNQWFCNLTHNDLKKEALAALQTIQFFPERSVNFLKATIENRLEWCLSRQRVWGVPIPALLCADCNAPYITTELVNAVADGVEQHGIEYWDTVAIDTLVNNLTCTQCLGKQFIKEKDILDVWFESGISHYAVLFENKALAYPADIYVEGVDQHRAWFQSSLLTSLILEEKPCTKSFYTHGFTVDQKGNKMSKSLGNVVSPDEIVTQIGTDGLRLWASTINNEGDAIVSPVLLRNVAEVYRKIRNTCRFLLSNLYDFSIQTDALDLTTMMLVDRYALEELYSINSEIRAAYDAFDLTKVFHILGDYCAASLSSTYLDIIKDRLYVERAAGFERRSAQTACWYILDTITRLMAPILSFSAELISDNYQKNKTDSIHLQLFPDLSFVYELIAKDYKPLFADLESRHGSMYTTKSLAQSDAALAYTRNEWDMVLKMRSALLKAIELLREQGIIKHSLEAALHIYSEPSSELKTLESALQKKLHAGSQTFEQFLKELLIVSEVTIMQSLDGLVETEYTGLYTLVVHAPGTKCPRCWHWQESVDSNNVCERCLRALK